MENYKNRKVVLAIGIIEDSKLLIANKPIEISVDGEVYHIPLVIMDADKTRLHYFIDDLFDKVELENVSE